MQRSNGLPSRNYSLTLSLLGRLRWRWGCAIRRPSWSYRAVAEVALQEAADVKTEQTLEEPC